MDHMICLIYVEMLGYDACFGYIQAIKITHDDSLPINRTGYLAVTLFLPDTHVLIILIINTIQKDLRFDNYLMVCAALNVACKLIADKAIPAVLPQVVDLLFHLREAIRKKVVMALHRFHQRSPSTVLHLFNFHKVLLQFIKGALEANKPVGGFKIGKEASEWTASNFHPYLPPETFLTCRFLYARKHGLVDVVVRNSPSDMIAS